MTKKKTVTDSLREGREFGPTLSKKELLNKVFTILETRQVTTQFGESFIASITLDGTEETVDAWLSGTVIDRQLMKLIAADQLPVKLKLSTDATVTGEPYVLVEPSADDFYEAHLAPKK